MNHMDPASPTPRPPLTYLPMAVASFFTGLVPLAIIAIAHASRVKELSKYAQWDEAAAASRKARGWVIATCLSGIILWGIAAFFIAGNSDNQASSTISGLVFVVLVCLLATATLVWTLVAALQHARA